MTQLFDRGKKIVDFLIQKEGVNNQEILAYLRGGGDTLSRATLIRELRELVNSGVIERIGRGRGVMYRINPLLAPLDVDAYFARDVDQRSPAPISFDFSIFSRLGSLFSDSEVFALAAENDMYRARARKLSSLLLRKEFERITIELAWKSSKIEGNTYTLLDTEALIKENKEAQGHHKEEAVMILNHKNALEYILGSPSRFRTLSLRAVEDVHRLLVDGLSVSFGIRSRAVGITGTAYRPLDNQHQITEALQKALQTINTAADAWSKALLALMLIAYIQPFEDGNKRTSRLIANACLLAYDTCPLSFRSIDETEYKKAMVLWYERRSASLIKKLFVEQWRFAVGNYFR